jgi:Flp pilus assembly protein TadD
MKKVAKTFRYWTVYNRTSLFLSVLLFGTIVTTAPAVTQAQIVVAQRTTPEVKQLLDEGRRLVDANDYGGAISVYQQAASLEPKNASIHSGIGYLYAIQGNLQAALSSYRRAVSLNPNNADFQYALGYISGNLGDNKTAKDAYRKAIQISRNNVNAYLGLATVLLRLGENTNALWATEQAMNLDRNNPQVFELRGTFLMKQGKSRDAIALFQKAREIYERQGKADSVSRIDAVIRQAGR